MSPIVSTPSLAIDSGAALMKHIARIAFRGGGIILPYRSPYDREVFFEHVTQCAKRYGDIRFELSGRSWTVSTHGKDGATCGLCNQVHRLSYISGTRILCQPCARRQLA